MNTEYFKSRPPEPTGRYIVQSAASTTAAANFDWGAALGITQGGVFIAVEAVTQDVYVRFKSTGVAGTTASNGRVIKAGSPATIFYVNPATHNIIDHLAATATATLKVQVVSGNA